MRPHSLMLDAEGLDSIRCAVLAADTNAPLDGFDFAQCDPIRGGGVTWQGKGLGVLAPKMIRLAVRLTGTKAKLFGLELRRR